ncbi:MAG TPA: hypothetical protein VGD14_18365 [bacterium]
MNRKLILCLIAWLIPIHVKAQIRSYELNGYAKYLFSSTKMPYLQDRLDDHLVHARINTRWYPTHSLVAALEIRLRGFYGESLETVPGFKSQITNEYDSPKLDAVLWDQKKSFGYGQIDRLYLDYTSKKLQITLGRQRIAWGTSLVWNVIDLFNPMAILDFDYEERPGSDALRMQYYTGAISKFEFAIKPGKNKYNTTAAALWSINKFGYDFYAIAALKNNRKMVGGAWAGNIRGAGFRGEFLMSDPPNKSLSTKYPASIYFGQSFFETSKPVMSFVLSADYTFPSSLYLHTETLFNNNGKRKDAGLFQLDALEAGMLSPARWSIFQEIAYDIHPLFRGTIFGILNPDDKSSVVMPSITWSVVTNFDLLVIGYYTFGDPLTEWGNWGNAIFTRLKYSF